MKVMIGIPAYKEEKNLGKLLNFLREDCLTEVNGIYVVCPRSGDKTEKITFSSNENDPWVHLIAEAERRGKASALNMLLAKSENYDVMVYMGADNLPEKGAVRKLIDKLRRKDVYIVGGRPVPLNSVKDLAGFLAHLLWNLHHLVSMQSPKISGELMAFKTGIIREVPPTIINDDMLLQSIFESQGYNVEYCDDVRVYLMGPHTLRDFIKQRRRVFTGHRQIRSLTGRKIPTMRWPKWNLILEACPLKGVKGQAYAVLFVIFQAIALLLSKWDFNRGNLPYKWDIVKTTKDLDCGS